MVFEGADGTLSGIAAMDMWRDELVVNAFVGHELLERGGGFVVEFLELRFETTLGEESMASLVGG